MSADPGLTVRFQQFATHDLPARDRVPYWREVFGRQIANIDIEPQCDGPFEAEATMLGLPGLRAGWCRSTTPTCWILHPTQLVKDGDDDIALLMPLEVIWPAHSKAMTWT